MLKTLKNKLVMTFLFIVTAVCLCIAAASCFGDSSSESANSKNHDITHTEAVAATCEKGGNVEYWYCKNCKKYYEDKNEKKEIKVVELEALGHEWDDGVTTPATCTKDGNTKFTCTREGCGKTRDESIKKLGHSWDDGTVTLQATCTNEGNKQYACTRENCTETKNESIRALGHNWSEGEVTAEPDCTTAGNKHYICTRTGCDATKDVTINALGHSWNNGTTTKAATCTEAGNKHYECTRAGCDGTKDSPISALGHNWNNGTITKTPTCTGTGNVYRTCLRENCNATRNDTIEPTGHSWGNGTVVTASTCYKHGTIRYYCKTSGCTGTKTEDAPLAAHTYEGGKCKVCDAIDPNWNTYTKIEREENPFSYDDGSFYWEFELPHSFYSDISKNRNKEITIKFSCEMKNDCNWGCSDLYITTAKKGGENYLVAKGDSVRLNKNTYTKIENTLTLPGYKFISGDKMVVYFYLYQAWTGTVPEYYHIKNITITVEYGS